MIRTSLLAILLMQTICLWAQKLSIPEQIEQCILPYAKSNNFSGTVYVSKGGKVIYEKSVGKASLELNVPVTNQTVYHLASVSKPFTATAILLLAEAGKLSTTDYLSKYVPEFRDGNKITIHHLLTHTSGITNINNHPSYDKLSLSQISLDSIIAVFKSMPLRFEPGTKYEYSNSNYNLLAFIIGKVSGMPYGDFLSKHIFQKLGMKDTRHNGDAQMVIERLATGYMESGRNGLQRAPYLDWTIKTGNGSLVSTVEDLAKFDRALYGDQLLTKASREKMFTHNLNDVGYGWFQRPDGDRVRSYINGRSPGYSAFFGRYTDEDLCIIVLSNIYVAVATEIGNKIAAVMAAKPVTLRSLNDTPLTEKETQALPGKYKFGDDFFRPQATIELTLNDGYLVSPYGELIRDNGDVFILRSFWSEITFKKDGNGKVTGLSFDGIEATRVE